MKNPKEELKKKADSEKKTRESILYSALRFYGPEAQRQVQMHFDKYDRILKSCKNDTEREHIKKIAIIELQQMMKFKEIAENGLSINGEEVLPPEKPKE